MPNLLPAKDKYAAIDSVSLSSGITTLLILDRFQRSYSPDAIILTYTIVAPKETSINLDNQ